ncbi:MAG TPA: DUF4388 domain-containing protein [Acidimicrobiales bacterium]|nr:DUF4388 domain-containing protein [Acidimicrobiales bacterium]
MSLQGTLETIPLPDVLALLAATKKTGELRVSGARGDGRLWFDAGLVVAADVPRATSAVEAVFELLRHSSGTFIFGDGSPNGKRGDPKAVDVLVGEAQQRLRSWQAIEAVVPSTTCTVRLNPDLGKDEVTISRQQWTELVAVAASSDVSGVMKALGLGEFDGSRTVKDLVDAGLAQVGKPAAQPRPAPEPPAAPRAERPAEARAPRPAPAAPSPAPAPPARPAPARPAPAAAAPAEEAPLPARRPGPGAPRAAAKPADHEGDDELVQQLASLHKGGAAKAAPAAPAAKPATEAAAPAAEAPAGDPDAEANGDEPLNRGMLLKFLSSVRP